MQTLLGDLFIDPAFLRELTVSVAFIVWQKLFVRLLEGEVQMVLLLNVVSFASKLINILGHYFLPPFRVTGVGCFFMPASLSGRHVSYFLFS